MSEPLSGKVVLVTGGAKRVGAAIARRLHREGANLMLHYRGSEREARALRTELNATRADSVALVQADLLDIAGLSEIVRKTVGRFERLAVLLNNAPTFCPTPVGEMTPRTWAFIISLQKRLTLRGKSSPSMEAGVSTYERARKSPFHPQAALRGGKARETPVPARRRGDRRLRHDPGGRPRHGVPLRRQGQLRVARRALEAARALAGFLRPHRRQPRSAPPRVPGARSARLPRFARHSLPHRGAGHLFRREARCPRRRDDVRAVLAAAPRGALSSGARCRCDQDRPGPPPRRYPGDVLPQPLLRRQDEGHVAEAAVRRRQTRRHPAARLRRRSGPRGLRQGTGFPDHPLRPLRLAARASAKAGKADAEGMGKTPPRAGGLDVPRPFQSRAFAPHGPQALRFRRGARDRKNVWRRRQGVRLERRTWNITGR